MAVRLTVFLPQGPALARLIPEGASVLVGRADDCDLRLDHPSISRHHARIEDRPDGWRIRDLGSKNGLRVDGLRTEEARLPQAAWISLGDVPCRWQPVGEDELARRRGRERERRALSQRLGEALRSEQGLDRLARAALASFLDIAECRRGFLLLRAGDGDLEVRHSVGLVPDELSTPRFAGSRGAVTRALESLQPVLMSDVREAPWLAGRPSVIAGGIGALACLPLRDGAGTLLGAIYADSDTPGKHFTELDLELMQAFAGQAALLLEAAALERALRAVEIEHTATRWRAILSRQSAA
jgi:hypothetical protein